MPHANPLIDNRNKEFLARGDGRGRGAKATDRHDFYGPVIHEFYKLKSILRSLQIIAIFAIIAFVIFGPFSSGLPQP